MLLFAHTLVSMKPSHPSDLHTPKLRQKILKETILALGPEHPDSLLAIRELALIAYEEDDLDGAYALQKILNSVVDCRVVDKSIT